MAIGVVLIILIIATDAIVISLQRQSTFNGYRTGLVSTADGFHERLAAWIGYVTSGLDACSSELTTGKQGAASILNDCIKRQEAVISFTLFGADGTIVASSRNGPFPMPNVAHEDFFQILAARADGRIALSKPFSLPGADPVFYFAKRLPNRGGQFAGLIAVEMSIRAWSAYYSKVVPAGRHLSFARIDGTILLRYPVQSDLRGGMVPAGSPWYALAQSGGGTYMTPQSDAGPARFSAVNRFKSLPLAMELSMPRSEIFAAEDRRLPWIIVAGIAACVAVVLLLRGLAAHLARLESGRRALETTEARLQATLANISHGVCFFGSDHRLIVSNRRYAEIYGVVPEAIAPGMALADILDLFEAAGGGPKGGEATSPASAINLVTAPGDRAFDAELQDGRTIAIQRKAMADGGWVSTHEDISERRRAEKKVAYLARHDSLTGLPNRAVLLELIQTALPQALRGSKFAILFLDLDRFKAVNDTLGHQAGDDLLKTVAARLRSSLRQIDTIARLGGDEFVVLQPCVTYPDDAARLAGRIIAILSEPYVIDDAQASIGVSIGMAMAPDDGDTAELLLKNADTALYLAKSEGRGTFRFFEPEMDAKLMLRNRIEADLRAALAEKQFELHYQPVVNIRSGEVVAFEALIRWNHPVRGRLAPGDFIGVAEECGLIVQIGQWVLGAACLQASQWPDAVRLAINLSPAQFGTTALVETVTGALAASGLAPHRLEVEITEGVLLVGNHSNMGMLHRLHDLGVTVAMDDFGVGYSSLSYLHCFPFDRIKIDRSFAANMIENREAMCIVRAMIGLCRALGIPTTVEGIESEAQLAIVRREEATDAQGYLFARPMGAGQIPLFLAKHQRFEAAGERLGTAV